MIALIGRILSGGFALLALSGFIAAVVVHGAALAGSNLLGDGMAGLFVLHAGIFVVMLPLVATLFLDRLRGRRAVLFGARPSAIVAVALFVYCGGTLVWMMQASKAGTLATGSSPAAMVTAARVFSTGWLLFYFVALAFFGRRALARD